MKKLLLITGILLLNFTLTAFGAEKDIIASISPFEVLINESSYIDGETYPSLFYNNVVYIPMTYDVGECVGRTIEWVDGYEQDVLLLTEKESENIIVKNTISENEINPRTVIAEIADCTVAVCVGENLNLIRGTAEYPLLRYKDIIYIPLTWENIVENFGWSYTFDEVNGVNIDASQSNISEKPEKDIYTSEDGSTTSYVLERKKYIDGDNNEKTDYTGLIRFNHDMTGKDLSSSFIIERELSCPVRQGDVRIFKIRGNSGEFYSPKTEDFWTFLHSATTMMLDARTGCINKWNALPSWRQTVTRNDEFGITSISMSGTDYVADSVDIINGEDSDIELKSIPMQYVIKRVDNGKDEVILTYNVPEFPGGSLIVPAPTSTITKVHFSLPRWDFRDVNGNYVPEGEYEISLVVPDKVEYVVNGETVVNENPKGLIINTRINLVK
ncbi:MAG: hypothetical protein IKA17_08190 [Clostridia bacterium]|nr:hypothetical protein [Clostridia bacterium]